MPRVAIAIPSFNHERYLGRAIESALAQTETDCEIFIFDDRSNDASVKVARSYDDARVSIVVNDRRLGLAGNYQQALRAGRAPYVKILCSDDYLYPNCVKRLADALDDRSDAALATSDRDVVDDAGSQKTVRLRLPADRPVSGREIVRRSWLSFNVIGGPSNVLLRRSAIPQEGFDERLEQMLDLDLWLRMLTFGPLVYVPEILSAYRMHADSATARNRLEARAAQDLLRMFTRVAGYRRYPPVTFLERKRLQVMCAARGAFGYMLAITKHNDGARRSCAALTRDAARALITASS